MQKNQDFEYVLGQHLRLAWTVTLDAGRSLDGSESWLWVMRASPTSPAIVSLVDPSQIEIDGGNFQPTCVLDPADFAGIKLRDEAQTFDHELRMTKDALVEPVGRGTATVLANIA